MPLPQLLHSRFAIATALYLLMLAVWGFGAYVLRRDLGPSFRSALVIAEVIIVVQTIMGIILLAQGYAPRDWLHLAYGTFVALGIPIVASYLRESQGRRRTLIYAIALLFIFGLSIRACTTGGS